MGSGPSRARRRLLAARLGDPIPLATADNLSTLAVHDVLGTTLVQQTQHALCFFVPSKYRAQHMSMHARPVFHPEAGEHTHDQRP